MKALLFAALTIATVYSQCQECYDELAEGTGEDNFVCARDGTTFINRCFALCNGFSNG